MLKVSHRHIAIPHLVTRLKLYTQQQYNHTTLGIVCSQYKVYMCVYLYIYVHTHVCAYVCHVQMYI